MKIYSRCGYIGIQILATMKQTLNQDYNSVIGLSGLLEAQNPTPLKLRQVDNNSIDVSRHNRHVHVIATLQERDWFANYIQRMKNLDYRGCTVVGTAMD